MAGEQQLAHRPHHHIGKEPDQHIDNRDRGAGDGDVAPRPHKQPGADGAPEGNHLDMAGAEPALKL